MRSDLERLQDIWQGINLIAEYTVAVKQSFAQNQLIQSGCTKSSSSGKLLVIYRLTCDRDTQRFLGVKSLA
ncbi:hypothetical protein [[Phormidium] sp. ETS-05]|uniref:hypothetical protein n=1 Tax=[Phormidium] sp. ETS-05 TaxID=222819 RepID=UPI001E5F8B46|nr:hypothetical protein [[Phormidium] sp. ETS-05]